MKKLNIRYIKNCITSAIIFGFLIYWDYVSIINKDYMSVIFSLLMWIGGGYIIYKRLFKNEHNEKQ